MAQKGIHKLEFWPIFAIFAIKASTLTLKNQQSLLEIRFSVFCNSFMSIWGSYFTLYKKTFNMIIAPRGIPKFAIFSHFPEYC